MNFTIANLRNKKCTVKVVAGDGVSSCNKVFLNDEELNVEKIRFVECSLTKEFVNVVLFLSNEYKKKTELFLEFSWLGNYKKLDDNERVEEANKNCCILFEKISNFKKVNEDQSFDGRIDGTYDLATLYYTGDYLVAPDVKKIIPLHDVSTCFFERMASYQKNFDLSLISTSDDITTVYTVNRKKFYKIIRIMLEKKEIYEGGPDPLPWPSILKTKKNNELTWKQIYDLYIGGDDVADEDESSDWSQGSSSEEDDDAEFDDLVEEEEEEDVQEVVSESSEDEQEEEDDFDDDFSNKRKYESSDDEGGNKKLKL